MEAKGSTFMIHQDMVTPSRIKREYSNIYKSTQRTLQNVKARWLRLPHVSRSRQIKSLSHHIIRNNIRNQKPDGTQCSASNNLIPNISRKSTSPCQRREGKIKDPRFLLLMNRNPRSERTQKTAWQKRRRRDLESGDSDRLQRGDAKQREMDALFLSLELNGEAMLPRALEAHLK